MSVAVTRSGDAPNLPDHPAPGGAGLRYSRRKAPVAPSSTRRRRVLHVRIGTPSPGGPERGILDLGEGMARLGHPVALAVLDDGRTRWDRLRAQYDGGQVLLLPVPMRGPFDLAGAVRLARLARAIDARVLHAHEYKSDVVARLAAPVARLPWVSTLHGVYRGDRLPRLYGLMDDWALSHAQRVFTVSAAERPEPAWVPRVEVVPNVVQVPPAPPLRSVDHPRRLIAVGRLEPQKGLDVLLRALAAARRRVPELSLTIVGDGSRRPALEALGRELGLGGAVAFTGWVPRVEGALDQADLLVMPSRWESQGRVALEAMARGLPVIGTRVGTLEELVTSPALGRLLDALSVPALAEALVWAAGRRFDSRRAWQVVRSHHAPDVLARRYLEAYRELGVELEPPDRRTGPDLQPIR